MRREQKSINSHPNGDVRASDISDYVAAVSPWGIIGIVAGSIGLVLMVGLLPQLIIG